MIGVQGCLSQRLSVHSSRAPLLSRCFFTVYPSAKFPGLFKTVIVNLSARGGRRTSLFFLQVSVTHYAHQLSHENITDARLKSCRDASARNLTPVGRAEYDCTLSQAMAVSARGDGIRIQRRAPFISPFFI